MFRPLRLRPQRSLFQKARLPKSPFKEETSSEAHEYSIGPETFAFKVIDSTKAPDHIPESSAETSSGTRSSGTSDSSQPMKSDSEPPVKRKFNLIDYVYRNATNYPFSEQTPQQVFDTYPKTNSARLARSKTRPRKSKMLVSDFIEDSLYNPHYGYFSKEVEIFHTEKPFDYKNIDDTDQFMVAWEAAYSRYDHEGQESQAAKETDTEKSGTEKSEKTKSSTALTKTSTRFSNGANVNGTNVNGVNEVTGVTVSNGVVVGQNGVTGKNGVKNGGKKPRMAGYAQQILAQDLAASPFPKSKKSTQLWHTPTELFSPHYGESLARYILVNYKLNHYPYQDLVIYEMGGGNGTLMCNILNHIKKHEPDIYARTQYKIIEISSQLAIKQYSQALERKLLVSGLDSKKLQIINKSIFNWDTTVDSHCFFIALEVFDNFAHDLVRYDNATGQPHEGHVLVDEKGDFYQFFTPQLSHYTNALLRMREHGKYPVLPRLDTLHGQWQRFKSIVPFVTDKDSIHPLLHSVTKSHWANKINPLKDNLSRGEFIPTRLLHFFQVLKHRFPNHSLISSDFHSLPNAMPGYYNAPVVQTVIKDKMVDVSTYMCHQGFFDIMFPTDFSLASDLYRLSTNKHAKVESHREFLEQWADIDAITTRKGEHPMLEFYKNVSFMTS